jgi:hypothetical protein
MAEFVNTMLNETNTLNLNIREFSDLIYDLAFDDSLELFDFLAKELDKTTSLRDLISQESDIKMFYMTYFSLNRLYSAISELELNKGYADILLLKAPNINEDIPNVLIEFKFLKQNDKVNEKELKQTISKAQEQITQYKQNSKFKIDKSIIVIFRGFEIVYCEYCK